MTPAEDGADAPETSQAPKRDKPEEKPAEPRAIAVGDTVAHPVAGTRVVLGTRRTADGFFVTFGRDVWHDAADAQPVQE